MLLAMGVLTLAGYLGLGLFATRLSARGFGPRHTYLAGWALNLAALAAIAAARPRRPALVVRLRFRRRGQHPRVHGAERGFPSALAGRANTAVNLTMFAGSFAAQWGIGVLADALRATMALSTADGLRGAFVIVLVMVAVAFAWFLAGWRRHAAPPAAAST
ncbi:MAG: hypothetical protein IPI87_17725 [Betaproteobacteria bacterium]|nr:hypothetical protein [Betaproteobacteria bacterium]